MLRMLPSHKHFRGKDLRITDPTEIDIAENNLIHLALMESFTVEMKTLTNGKPILKVGNLPYTLNLSAPLVSFVPPDGSFA